MVTAGTIGADIAGSAPCKTPGVGVVALVTCWAAGSTRGWIGDTITAAITVVTGQAVSGV